MIALRRFLSSVPLDTDGIAAEELGTLQVTRDDFLAGLKEVEAQRHREFFIEKKLVDVCIARRSPRGETLARWRDRALSHAQRNLRAGRTRAAARHPAGRTIGHWQDCHGARAFREKQIPLIAIDGPQLYSKWLGESERALREVFKKARRAAPCILFFDTIDAVAPKFGADQFGSDIYQRILSQLLREIDNLRA